MKYKTLRPDSKGRVTLGKLAQGVSGFRVIIDKQRRVILEPLIEIPAREKWLFDNPTALRQLKQGIKDAADGKVVKKDFSSYLDDDVE